MTYRAIRYCSLLILLAGVPVYSQTSSTPAQQPAPPAPQEKTEQPPSAGYEIARTTEDIRERILLDRIDQLEKRVAELEARDNSSPEATTPQSQAPASAAASAPTPATPAASPAQSAAPAAPPEAAPTWSIGPIDFSGLVDGYYVFNANHPASSTNQLYNFDTKANQFSLNMAKLSMSHTADPVGFQVDLGFGRAFQIMHASEPNDAPGILQNVEQAYVSLKPAALKGFEVDLGQFVTSAGAELIETNSNWNYSRSLLFAWAIPYYHFGIRTSFPVGKHFTGGVQLVNGWNDTEDNNSGKTLGLTEAITYTKFSWTNTYYGGPENPGTNKGWRQLIDSVLLLTPSSKLNAYLNYDYGQNTSPLAAETGIYATSTTDPTITDNWYGIAGALHFQPTSKWSFTPRIEWFKDSEGFATGKAQDLKEITLTGEYKMAAGFLTRLEYRHDWSNQLFFDRGLTPASSKSEDTVALGFVGFFGPKR
jgi:hypothetical protein